MQAECRLIFFTNYVVSWRVLTEHFAIGIEVPDFDSWAGQIGHSVAIAATCLRSCVAWALKRGDGTSHSLNVLV